MSSTEQQSASQQPSVADSASTQPASSSSSSSSSSSPSSTTIELRCLLDNTAVGAIIGKGGNSVRSVREESGAFVSIVKAEQSANQRQPQQQQQPTERIMILKGNADQVAAAAKGIAAILIDTTSRRENRTVETAQLRVLVHKGGVGAIIGKGGETIKSIATETGCRIQVSNDTLPHSSEKTVTLTGNASQMQSGVGRVAAQLLSNPLKAGTKVYYYQPTASFPGQFNQGFNNQMQFQNQNNQYGGNFRAPANNGGLMSTQKIAIPSVCCGSIIGKSGNVIRNLRQQSGCNISIADADNANPNERIVSLVGTSAAISHAVFLIRQLVEAYQPNQNNNQQ